MIFQHFNLLMQKNVVDNVAFPLRIQGVRKREAREQALEYLKVVGLTEKAKAYPSKLSGGQKQRVAIARALASKPHILLCDEATSALDPQTTQSILELLKGINRQYGITIVMITHQMEVIQKICHRVAIIENGEVAEEGTVEKVFRHPQSEAGRKLILKEQLREGKEPINILYANTRDVNGTAKGEMILGVSDQSKESVIQYLRDRNLTVWEVDDDVDKTGA